MRPSSTVFIATTTFDAAATTVHVAATMVEVAAPMADAASAIAHTGAAESSYATDSAASNATTADAVHTGTVTLPLAANVTAVSTTTATFANAIFGKAWFDGPACKAKVYKIIQKEFKGKQNYQKLSKHRKKWFGHHKPGDNTLLQIEF
jgi:hypothetical protein